MFGLGKGKIDLILEKTSYAHGEVVNGQIKMMLKKPIQAKGVIVTLFAERVTTTMYNGSRQRKTQKVFEFSIPVDGEKLYEATQKDYTFQIQVPQENEIKVEGKIGGALKAIQSFGKMMSPTKWFIEAKLDVPKGFDVRKKQQINVV